MKITIKEYPPPPKKIILELTEEEAGLIYCFASFYTDSWEGDPSSERDASTRLKDALKPFGDSPVYPFTKAFV